MKTKEIVEIMRHRALSLLEEYSNTITFHEIWKPAAFDVGLMDRMSYSIAGNSFLFIRIALRREVILSLTRIWDTSSDSISLPKLMNCLIDRRVQLYLANKAVTFRTNEITGCSKLLHESNNVVTKEFKCHVMRNFQDTIKLYEGYIENGIKRDILESVKTFRDEYLAHSQLVPKQIDNDLQKFELDLNTLYTDTGKLIESILSSVRATHVEIGDLASIRERQA